MDQTYTFWNLSQGTASREGGWAKGATPDGHAEFEYIAEPQPLTSDMGLLEQGDPRLHGTPKAPMPAVSEGPNPRDGQEVPSNVKKGEVKKNATG